MDQRFHSSFSSLLHLISHTCLHTCSPLQLSQYKSSHNPTPDWSAVSLRERPAFSWPASQERGDWPLSSVLDVPFLGSINLCSCGIHPVPSSSLRPAQLFSSSYLWCLWPSSSPPARTQHSTAPVFRSSSSQHSIAQVFWSSPAWLLPPALRNKD